MERYVKFARPPSQGKGISLIGVIGVLSSGELSTAFLENLRP